MFVTFLIDAFLLGCGRRRAVFMVALLWPLASVSGVSGATPEEIKAVAQDMVCLCGNCNRESLATCICTDFAVPHRQAIGLLLDEGKTHKEIVDLYIQDFGAVVLAAPPPTGYNLVAWLAPFAALLFGIVLIRSVVLNWRRGQTNAPDTQAAGGRPTDPGTADYQTRLRQELKDLDEET